MRNKILIYCDYGCADISSLNNELNNFFSKKNIDIEKTDANSIIKNNALNKNVLAFFMPGGAGNPYSQKLKHQGNDKIYDYVEKGGVYFGLCAGAYYACRKTIFENDVDELRIVDEYGLNLIEANAVGTLSKQLNIGHYDRTIHSNAAAKISLENSSRETVALYHGGPYFELNCEHNQQVEARYKDVEGTPPAIVSRNVGKGMVILSGVHLEVSGENFKKRTYISQTSDKDKAKDIFQKLISEEEGRKSLFDSLMNKIVER